jgi:hypothetical protein
MRLAGSRLRSSTRTTISIRSFTGRTGVNVLQAHHFKADQYVEKGFLAAITALDVLYRVLSAGREQELPIKRAAHPDAVSTIASARTALSPELYSALKGTATPRHPCYANCNTYWRGLVPNSLPLSRWVSNTYGPTWPKTFAIPSLMMVISLRTLIAVDSSPCSCRSDGS